MDGLEDTIAQLKACIDGDDFEFAPSGAELFECLERCQDEVADQQATITELEIKVDIDKITMDNFLKRIDGMQATITELEAEVDRQKKRYHQVRHENTDLQAEVDRYREFVERVAMDDAPDNYWQIDAEQVLEPTTEKDDDYNM